MDSEREAMRALLDRTQIIDLSHRYSRACDRLDRDLLSSVYWPDGSDDHGSFRGSAPDYVDWVMNLLASWVSTLHHNGNFLIELDGDDAYGELHWTGYYTFRNEAGELQDMLAAGRYLDRYQRRNGEWRILHRSCVSDWRQILPGEAWRDASGSPLLVGRRGQEDLSYHIRELG